MASDNAVLYYLLTRAQRQGRISAQETLQLLGDALQILRTLQPGLPLLPRAAELSSQARIGVYDCLYIALVEREQRKLVTADQRLVNLFPAQTLLLQFVGAAVTRHKTSFVSRDPWVHARGRRA